MRKRSADVSSSLLKSKIVKQASTAARSGRAHKLRTASVSAAAGAALSLMGASSAQATTIYWEGGDGGWGTLSKWSTDANGTTDPGAVPGASDDVIFDVTAGSSTAQNVTLGTVQLAKSLTFNTSGATTITAGGVTNRTLSLGSGGIVLSSGAGIATIGSATNNQKVDVSLAGSQAWTNNSSGLLTLNNNVSNATGVNPVLTIDGTGSGGTTFAGVISGSTGLVINTANGTTRLDGNNTFTGGLTLAAGTLSIGQNANNLGGAANVITINGGTINVNKAVNITNNYVQNWNGDLAVSGGFGLNFSGTTGTATLGKSIAINVTTVATSLTYAGVIQDGLSTYGLAKIGAGTLTLAGSNTYDGDTVLSAGTLAITAAINLGSSTGSLKLDGGTLQINGTTLTSLAGLSRTVVISVNKDLGLNINDSTNVFDVNQSLSLGTGGFTKSGAGTAVLSQANSFTGNTTVSAGTLRLDNALALQNSTVTPGGTGIVFNGQTAYTFGGLSGSGNLLLSNNASAAVNLTVGSNDQSTTYSGILSGAGKVTKAGSGALNLSNSSNSFSGGVELTAGTLNVGASTTGTPVTSGPLGTGTLTISGGVLAFTGSNNTIGNAIAVGGSATFDYASATASGTTTLAGPMTLNSGAAITYTNSAGTLNRIVTTTGQVIFGANATITQSTISGTSWTGGFDLTGVDRTLTINGTGTGTVTLSGALNDTVGANKKLVLAGNKNVTVGAILAGTSSPAIEINGSAVYNFNSTSGTYAGGTILTAGTLAYSASSTGSPVTGGPLGTGTVTLNSGTFQIASAGPTLGNNIVVSGAVTFDYAQASNNQRNTLTGGVLLNSGAAITYTQSAGQTGITRVNAGLTTLTADATVNLNSVTGTAITWSGGLDVANGDRTLTVNGTGGDTLALAGVLQDTGGTGHALTLAGSKNISITGLAAGTGSPGVVINGSATYTFSGSSTYTAGTTLTAGTLKFGATNALSSTGLLTLNGGVVDINNLAQSIGGLAGNSNAAGNFNSTGGNKTLTLSGSGNYVFSGGINPTTPGSVALTVALTGGGVQTFSGSSSYTGATAITGGTLRVDGSLAGSAVTVNTAGTLGGAGTVSGSVAIGSSGKLSPGSDGVGTLTTGALSFSSGGKLSVDLRTSGSSITGANQVSASSLANLGAGVVSLEFASSYLGTVTNSSDLFVIVNNTGAGSAQSATNYFSNFGGANANGVASFSLNDGLLAGTIYYKYDASNNQTTGGNDIAVSLTSVPEPTNVALIGLGSVGLLKRRRRTAK